MPGIMLMAVSPAYEDAPTKLLAPLLAFHFFDHVINDVGVFTVRTKHDDVGVYLHLYVMSRRPVKKIIRAHCLLHAETSRSC